MVYADDRNAGKIIDFVCSWYPHAKRRRKHSNGVWSVFSRQELCVGSGLSLKQYKRAMPVAVRSGAIDYIMGGHQGKKAIFTRPTAALTRFLRDATDRRSALRLRPKGTDGGTNGGANLIQSSHSLQSTEKEDETTVSEGEGRAAGRLPPARSASVSPARLVEPEGLPPGEPVPCPAEPESLLSRVQAAKASGLDDSALRDELMRLLPPSTRKYDHKIWHPSEKYPAWQTWSPDKLVEKYRLYEQYVENWYRSHPDAKRRAADSILPLEDCRQPTAAEQASRDEISAMWAKKMTYEEYMDGYDID